MTTADDFKFQAQLMICPGSLKPAPKVCKCGAEILDTRWERCNRCERELRPLEFQRGEDDL